MTLKKWQVRIAAVVFLMGPPSLQAQDFLKQLEAKLFQKQQESKSKDTPSANKPTKESIQGPLEFPSFLEPEGSTTPALLKPQDENESLELPAPKVESKVVNPKKPAPTLSKTDISPFPRPSIKSAPKSAPLGGGGFLGLTVDSIPGGGFGLTVVEVAADSPAWKAGFRNGDKVVGVSGQAVSTVDAFAEQLAKFSPGTAVKFLVDRRGQQKNIIAVLQDRGIAGQIQGARPGTVTQLDADIARNSRPGPAYLGINVSDMSDAYRRQFSIPAYRGASVTEVVPNSPAHSAGIKPGDCIVEIEGATVQTADVVFDTITRARPGQVISISYYRGRQLNSASIQLISSSDNDGRSPSSVIPEMLTPEYVASLQGELERVHAELSETQARLQQLEARLQRIENKR